MEPGNMLDVGATALTFGTDGVVAIVDVSKLPRSSQLDDIVVGALTIAAYLNKMIGLNAAKFGENVAHVLCVLYSLGRTMLSRLGDSYRGGIGFTRVVARRTQVQRVVLISISRFDIKRSEEHVVFEAGCDDGHQCWLGSNFLSLTC